MRRTIRTVTASALLALCAGIPILAAGPACAQVAPDPVGDWHGALPTPIGELTLVLSVARRPDGSLNAQLESRDQAPGTKFPATSISVTGEELAFDISSLHASFKGRWIAAEQAWQGTFSQGADLPLKLVKGAPPPRPVIAGMEGLWNGKVTRNGVDLRMILRIRTTPVGTVIMLDSPDQLANGLPVRDFSRDGRKVGFRIGASGAEAAAISPRFEGLLSEDGQTLSGRWSAPNQPTLDLAFVRSTQSADRQPPARPQTPKPPFPYKAEEVAFDNPAAAGVHLAGTLTLPEGAGPFPAAILITGSGQQDRDETIMGHKPFAVIADALTRRGIAVLRVDDRGVGKSTGPFANATSADFATDSNAAFAYLRTRKDIRPDAIGFIGHSEGGLIGPIAMADNSQVAFLVMLAGPGTALDRLLLTQRRLLGATMGQSEAEMNRAEPVMAALFKAVASGNSYEEGLAAARAVLTPEAMTAIGAPPGMDKEMLLRQVASPWFRYFFRYDPTPNLRRITVPVLALNGSLDRQVPPAENLAAIKAALKDNRDVTAAELPGLNHLFQTAKTGAIGEYAEIEETIAPAVLDRMASWINARFGKK